MMTLQCADSADWSSADTPRLSGGLAGGRRDTLEQLFVLGVWGALALAVSGLIVTLGSSVPLADDWSFVPTIADSRSLPVAWLWEQSADHRAPIKKLAMWLVWQGFPGDLRAAMLCGFIGLALGVLGLLALIRFLRGRTEYTDAFFPLLLMNFGHANVFLWWTTIDVPWYAAVESLLVVGLVLGDPAGNWRRLLLFGTGLTVLLVTGSLGVACGLPLLVSLCLAIPGCVRVSRARAGLAAAFAAAAVAVVVAYFWGFDRQRVQSPFVSFSAWLSASLQYLTVGFGPATKRFWPASGLAVVGATAVAAGLLVYRITGRRASVEGRVAAAMSLLALASPVAGAVAVGLGRQLQGGLAERYALYAAPFACVLYALSAKYAPRHLGRMFEVGLFALACAGLFFGFSFGLGVAKQRQDRAQRFRADIEAGLPLTALVARHGANWGLNEDSFRSGLEVLQKAQVGMFARIAADPPMDQRSLSAVPTRTCRMMGQDGWWRSSGRASLLSFDLSAPRRVLAIRFSYVLRSRKNSATFRVYWDRGAEHHVFERVGECEVTVNFNSAKPRRLETQTVWIDEVVQAFAISPSEEACEFQLKEVVLLVPRDGGASAAEHAEAAQPTQ